MKRTRQFAILASGFGIAAALIGAPFAGADEDGGGGPGNPLTPTCNTMGGSSINGGQTTDCASPGNSELTATPNNMGEVGAQIDEPIFGFGGL
jgi:hypothetical protein